MAPVEASTRIQERKGVFFGRIVRRFLARAKDVGGGAVTGREGGRRGFLRSSMATGEGQREREILFFLFSLFVFERWILAQWRR